MMLVVLFFTVRTLPQRKNIPSFWWRNGPLMLVASATVMMMMEPSRHVLGDANLWAWCGSDGTPYLRINQTWNQGCLASSTEYLCNIPCCVTVEDLTTNIFNVSNGVPVPYAKLAKLYEDTNLTAAFEIEHNHQFPQLDLADAAYNHKFEAGLKWDNSTIVVNGTNVTNATQVMTYECTCNDCMGSIPEENFSNLSPVGWIFTFTFSYLGIACLAFGSLWNANIISKCKNFKKKWRQLRAQSKNTSVGKNVDTSTPLINHA